MPPGADVLQGTLDLLILKAASLDPMHGWGLSQRIQQLSRGTLDVHQGSLYPALHRLVKRGLLSASWGTSENNRRARYYTLTAAGRKQLAAERAEFDRMVGAIQRVLGAI
jgi:PadR family transcriptional regulator